jgi:hypothetical protein
MNGDLGKALAKMVTAEMPRDKLEDYIISLLQSQTMCTLCTCSNNLPRGTPLEYFPDGLVLYCSPDPGIKISNLKANQNVSIAIYNVLEPDWENGWNKVWGMQVTGRGALYEPGSREYNRGLQVIRWQSFMRALGRPIDKPPPVKHVLKVTPSKIEVRNTALIDMGFSRRQNWVAETSG